MKIAFIVLLALTAIVDPVTIRKINSLKREAREAYTAGDYKTAIAKYRYLVDSLDAREDEVMLNLANAYFNAMDTTQALAGYQSVLGSDKADIRSKAQQQLGVMNHRAGRLEEALNNFKQAIKSDPNNRDARYNYEMLKKKLEEEKKKQQQQDQQNRDKQNKENQKKDDPQKDQKQKQDEQKSDEQKKKEQEQKDQQQKEQQQKEREEKEKQKQDQQNKEDAEKKDDQRDSKEEQEKTEKQPPPDWSKKLQDMKMSEEKARMILEAMKNQEKQYLQQNQRKGTKPRDKGKPDW